MMRTVVVVGGAPWQVMGIPQTKRAGTQCRLLCHPFRIQGVGLVVVVCHRLSAPCPRAAAKSLW